MKNKAFLQSKDERHLRFSLLFSLSARLFKQSEIKSVERGLDTSNIDARRRSRRMLAVGGIPPRRHFDVDHRRTRRRIDALLHHRWTDPRPRRAEIPRSPFVPSTTKRNLPLTHDEGRTNELEVDVSRRSSAEGEDRSLPNAFAIVAVVLDTNECNHLRRDETRRDERSSGDEGEGERGETN